METISKPIDRTKLDISKFSHLKTGEQFLTELYGAEGTETRRKFVEKAEVWYFAEILKEERKAQKLTQKQLADKIGSKREYIALIEKGQTDIQISTFFKIIRALGLQFSLM